MNNVPDQQQSLEGVPIIFVHGIKGAKLVNSVTGKKEWISLLQGINVGKKPKLCLPLNWERDAQGVLRQATDNVVPTTPIRTVGKMLWMYKKVTDMCEKWAKEHHSESYFYCYDWRRDPMEATDGLVALLTQLGRPVFIVAHSMGGLVTYAAIAQVPNLVRGVVFVATPFQSSNAYLEDLTPGTPAYVRHLPIYQTVTMTSLYSLFPIVADQDRIGSPEFWVNHRLGWFGATAAQKGNWDEAHIVQHLSCCMDRAKAFRRVIESPLPEQGRPHIAIIASDKHNTRYEIKDLENPDFSNKGMLCAPGDGRVTFSSATAIPGMETMNVPVFKSKKPHVNITDETKLIRKILASF